MEKNARHINLVYSGGEGDSEGVLFSLISASRFSVRPLRVCVLTTFSGCPGMKGIDERTIRRASAVLRQRNDGSELEPIDAGEWLEEFIREKSAKELHDPYKLLPLFADRFPLNGRQLFLCPETLFCADPQRVFDLDLRACPAGGTCRQLPRLLYAEKVIDRGVTLIDMEEARRVGLFEKARRLFDVSMRDPLTDALNLLSQSELREIPLRWLPGSCNESGRWKKGTLIRRYRSFHLLPYPHFSVPTAKEGYRMSEKEFGVLSDVYSAYLYWRSPGACVSGREKTPKKLEKKTFPFQKI